MEGFCNALWAVATLKPGAGHLSAPVCSTFVVVNLRKLFNAKASFCLHGVFENNLPKIIRAVNSQTIGVGLRCVGSFCTTSI